MLALWSIFDVTPEGRTMTTAETLGLLKVVADNLALAGESLERPFGRRRAARILQQTGNLVRVQIQIAQTTAEPADAATV